MKKKQLCLVTGGAGFIGSHLVDALLAQGYRVRVLDNFSNGKMTNLHDSLSRIELLRGDLRKEKDLQKAVRGVTYVFHAAAMRAVLRSVENPIETHDVNVTGTLKLLIACRKAGVKRVIFSSSSSVYGDTQKFPTPENVIPQPESPYAASKVMGEYYCKNFWTLYGLETVSLRYFNVFGPRQDPKNKYANVIPLFIEGLYRKKPLEIHWDGKQSRDFCYIDNVVLANLLAMKAPKAAGETFNIGGHQEISLLDFLKSLKKIMKASEVKLNFKPKRAGDVRRTFADISKARGILGYRKIIRFEEGLRRTVRWFLEHPEYF